ncbi:hypothetical protein [Natrinema sp. J7-1]|uniref:hypothetical protein n=1 Tax=Natrinema sp. J7-1 TaxID=1172566 RepID=UPI0012DF92D0|nr:hypothetical protein [Natrinema sp. J7-1]
MDTTIPLIDTVPHLSQIGPTAASIGSQDALGEQLPSAETFFRRLGIEFNDWIERPTVGVTFGVLFESLRTDILVTIHYANLYTPKQYSIRFVTESDAGTKTKTHVIQRQQGIYPGITGFRADAPRGTATDGTANLSHPAILREEGTKVETEEGVLISYE